MSQPYAKSLRTDTPNFGPAMLFSDPEVIQLHPSPRTAHSDPRRSVSQNRSSLGGKHPGMAFLPQAHISGALTLKNSRWAPFVLTFSPLEICHADKAPSMLRSAFAVFITKRLVEGWLVFLIRS